LVQTQAILSLLGGSFYVSVGQDTKEFEMMHARKAGLPEGLFGSVKAEQYQAAICRKKTKPRQFVLPGLYF